MSDNPFKNGILPCSNLEILCKDYIKELEQRLSDQDRVLRATVPERHKSASSPVGCVQNYIGELEQQLSNSIGKVDVFSMIKACEDLKQDLLERADEEAKGIKIVGVSHNKWLQFKRELSKLNKLIEGDK